MSKMTYMLLSDDERMLIKQFRGRRLTGYPCHEMEKRGCYYWPWGRQPSGVDLAEIIDPDPIRAANKFLAHYKQRVDEFSSDFKSPERSRS